MKFTRLTQLFAAAAILVLGAFVARADEIKIGYNGDLSASPSAQSGQNAVLGLQAAVDDINAQGGLLGRKLLLVTRDDLGQPPKSIQNMTDLIDGEKVVAVFGPTNSGNALAWKHIPNQKKIPAIGTVGGATDITKPMPSGGDNYMFRVSMVDRYQVAALMTYVANNKACKKIGYMAETTGFGQGGLKDIEEVGAMQGIKPIAVEKFSVTDTDMTSQLNKMKAAGVDTIVAWAQGTPTAHLVRSMEKINYFPLLLTSWASDNVSFTGPAGTKLVELPIFMRTVPAERTKRQEQLFKRLEKDMKSKTVWSFCAHSYDAVMLFSAAVKQAGTTDGPKVKAALENLKGSYEGYMKTYKQPFSATDHEALKPWDLHWTKWQGGNMVPFSDSVVKSLKASDFKL